MKLRNLIGAGVGAVALLSTGVTAQAGESEKPTVPQRFSKLVGKWQGSGTFKTGGKTLPIRANYYCARSSGGAGIKCSFRMTGLPDFTYQFDDLWGYSNHDGLVHWYTVTNAGETHDHSGRLDEHGALLQFAGPSEGKAFHEQIRFVFKGGKHLTLDWSCNVDGKLRESGHLSLSK